LKKKTSITFEAARKAKLASYDFQKCTALDRKKALKALSENILANIDKIILNNKKDLANAKKSKLSEAMTDRLLLNSTRISAMAEGVLAIANQTEVVGEITSQIYHKNGMLIKKQRVPLGVIGMIFESRPNVVIDCAALAIKSCNAILLKGGSEAQSTNACLAKITQESISEFIPKEVVQLIAKREQVKELLTLKQFIDVIIPRGGEKLIQYVCEHAKMPVIAHFKGLCHGYIHSDANLENAISICMNAKVQRPGVCNAMETLLLHKDLPVSFLRKLFLALQNEKIELRVNKPLFTHSEVRDEAH
jgi:glutamate-5-semialdehyde dehydrogenase